MLLALAAAAVLIGPLAQARPNILSLGMSLVFAGYIMTRAFLSPGYVARADFFSAMACLLIYMLTVCFITSPNTRSAIWMALLAFGLAHVFVGLIQFSRGDNFMPIPFLQRPDYEQRASGFYVCPNHLAGLLEVLAIFGVSFIFFTRWPIWSRVLIAYATMMAYAGLIITGSRGGYLSALISLVAFGIGSLLVLGVARHRDATKLAAIGFALAATIVLAGWGLIRQSGFLEERAKNLIDTGNIRFVLWGAAIDQWKLEPAFGTGAGSYRYYGRKFRTKEMQQDPIDVHNDYLHLLCEYGIVGSAVFLAFLAVHLREIIKTLRDFGVNIRRHAWPLRSNRLALQLGALGAIAAYIAHSVVDFNLHIPANALLLAFVFAMVPQRPNRGPSPEQSHSVWFVTTAKIALGLLALGLLYFSLRLLPGEYFTDRARRALRDEEPRLAMEFAQKALQYESGNPDLYFYLGRANMALDSESVAAGETAKTDFLDRALAAFKQAHQLAPLDGTFAVEIAFVYDLTGRFPEAEAYFAVARSCDPLFLGMDDKYHAHLQMMRAKSSSPSS